MPKKKAIKNHVFQNCRFGIFKMRFVLFIFSFFQIFLFFDVSSFSLNFHFKCYHFSFFFTILFICVFNLSLLHLFSFFFLIFIAFLEPQDAFCKVVRLDEDLRTTRVAMYSLRSEDVGRGILGAVGRRSGGLGRTWRSTLSTSLQPTPR